MKVVVKKLLESTKTKVLTQHFSLLYAPLLTYEKRVFLYYFEEQKERFDCQWDFEDVLKDNKSIFQAKKMKLIFDWKNN